MGFFNEDFYKELDKSYIPEEEQDDNVDDDIEEADSEYDDDDSYYGNDVELTVNKNNQEKFKDIMDNASMTYDSYWDFNNPVIRFILIVLGVIIVVGIIYYVVGWLSLI